MQQAAGRRRAERTLVSKFKARRRRILEGGRSIAHLSGVRIGGRPRGPRRTSRRNVIFAPEVFGLHRPAARASFLRFLGRLRQQALLLKDSILIDFSLTRRMFPEGTLLFAAELDRINRASASSGPVRCTYPVDNVVEQVLQQLGLLAMMGMPARSTVTADNVKYWQVDSGVQVEGARTEPLIAEYSRLFSDEEGARMYKGLTEAMTNSMHHAYIEARGDRVPLKSQDSRWWMLCQKREGRLYVAFCDLGIGINRSLREGRKWSVAQVAAAFRKLGIGKSDSGYIRAAMELGRTRTKLAHRGNGLHDMRSVFEDLDSGALTIFSNRGRYTYDAHLQREVLQDYRPSILGTVITWHVAVPEQEPEHDD